MLRNLTFWGWVEKVHGSLNHWRSLNPVLLATSCYLQPGSALNHFLHRSSIATEHHHLSFLHYIAGNEPTRIGDKVTALPFGSLGLYLCLSGRR